jgi:hypothetical protein
MPTLTARQLKLQGEDEASTEQKFAANVARFLIILQLLGEATLG